MHKALIVDDEIHLRESLKDKLDKHCPEIEVVGMASNANEAYELLTTAKPDVVFLDVQMPNQTGIDLLKRFDDIDFEVIFVTGFDSYAIQAIEFCAIGYILKPVSVEKLKEAVGRIRTRPKEEQEQRLEALLENSTEINPNKKKIGISGIDGVDFVEVRNIIRLEGANKYTVFHFDNKESVASSYSIGVFKKMLANHDFYLTHKSHLVNLKHIKRYSKDGSVLLSDGSSVPVAIRKKKEFQDLLKKI